VSVARIEPTFHAPGAFLEPGTVLGKYEIVRQISIGGMAQIYLARVTGIEGFQKRVVLKRVRPEYANNRQYVNMFLDEARLAATLDHPNIAQVYDVGTDHGNYFITMEYVHGEDLRRILAAEHRRGRRVPLDSALPIVTGLCAGLYYAHSRTDATGQPLGIVHRDVSLSNVLVSHDGAVKIVDFGVAKYSAKSSETRVGTLKGKIAYMSPEQCRGEPLDCRSDIFAIGIVLYELTTGGRLFGGGNEFALLQKIATEQVEPPSKRVADYPAELDRIVLRALARDRKERYQTAREMQRDLELFAQTHGVSTSSIGLADYMQSLFGIPENTGSLVISPRPMSEDDEASISICAEDDAANAAELASSYTGSVVGPGRNAPLTPSMGIPSPGLTMELGGLPTGSAPRSAALLTARPQDQVSLRPHPHLRVVLPACALAVGIAVALALRPGEPPADTAATAPGRAQAPAAALVASALPAGGVPVPGWTPAPGDEIAAPGRATDREPAAPTGTVARPRPPRPGPAASRPARAARQLAARRPARSLRAAAADEPVEEMAPAARTGTDHEPASPPPAAADEPAAPAAPIAAPAPERSPRPLPEDERPAPTAPVRRTPARPAAPALPLAATASIGDLDLDGAIPLSEVRRAVERVMPQLRDCYHGAARKAGRNAHGGLQVSIVINESGLARKVQVSSHGLPGVQGCVASALQRVRTRTVPDVGVARVSFKISYGPVR
jgi:serine/threonine protein kinase